MGPPNDTVGPPNDTEGTGVVEMKAGGSQGSHFSYGTFAVILVYDWPLHWTTNSWRRGNELYL